MRALIFNPDTEMALASGGKSYTPPAAVRRFITHLSLLPSLYADEGDCIIVPRDVKRTPQAYPYFNEVRLKKLGLVELDEVPDTEVSPWGWNMALRHALASAGVSAEYLPTLVEIERLRELAHRRTTIDVLRKCGLEVYKLPRFLQNRDEIETYVHECRLAGRDYVVKQPWSSSGRGVSFSPGIDAALQACSRQGGVLIEPFWEKTLDFATEWECIDGKICFLGYSLFESSAHGNYSGNVVASQTRLRELITKHCSEKALNESVNRLGQALAETIAPYYKGPLGVDMLCDTEGNINPCVEINLRRTMGHVALSLYERHRPAEPVLFSPGNSLI